MPPNPKWTPGMPGIGKPREKGLTKLIKEVTGARGERLVEILRQVAEGDVAFTRAQQRAVERLMKLDPYQVPSLVALIEKINMPALKERLDAVKILMDQGHGKATEHISLEGADGGVLEIAAMDLSKFTMEELKQWRTLSAKAGAARTGSGETVEAQRVTVQRVDPAEAGGQIIQVKK